MSIQEHLDKIRNAIKGREVRESIAKGIETAYDDASEKDNANMEVKIARGTHPNLRSRLEEVDNKQQQSTAQLDHKVDRVELDPTQQVVRFYANERLVSTIDLVELGNIQAVQNYIDTLVSEGQIEGVTLHDRIVTPKKTTFAEELNDTVSGGFQPTNIFDVTKYIESTVGSFLSPENGEPVSNQYTQGYLYSEPYTVFPEVKYIRKKGLGAASIIFERADGSFISGLDLDNAPDETVNGVVGKSFYTPANCYRMRLNGFHNRKEDDFIYQMEVPKDERAIVIKNLRLPKTQTQSNLENKKIAFFGDSLFVRQSDNSDIPKLIAEATGASVYNLAFGGTRMGKHPQEQYDAFSMYKLVDAIVDNDYSLQQSALASDVPSNYSLILAELMSLDFNDMDILCINHMTNDWGGNDPKDIEGDLLNTNSYKGAYRYVLQKIITNFPHLKIMLVSGLYRFDVGYDQGQDSDTAILGAEGYKFPPYVDGAGEIAREFKLPYTNLYYESGINKYNRDYYFNSDVDKVHPNIFGRQRETEKIIGELELNF